MITSLCLLSCVLDFFLDVELVFDLQKYIREMEVQALALPRASCV